MTISKKTSDQLETPVGGVGGEPLTGSGFENEQPEELISKKLPAEESLR